MNPSKQTLEQKLQELESASKVYDLEIATEIRNLRNNDLEDDPCQEWVHEVLAFTFAENCKDRDGGWGTYFGPFFRGPADDGKPFENPSLSQVTKETLAYWRLRYSDTKNPILKARYAGLVWDLSEAAVGEKPDHNAARSCCEAILAIAQKKLYKYEIDMIGQLGWALSVAASVNAQGLINRCKMSILELEVSIAEDSKAGTWGFSFDLLVGNKRVKLSKKKEDGIIKALEDRLQRLSQEASWASEYAAERLAHYYRSKARNEDVSRVIRKLGAAFETAADREPPLAAHWWLERMRDIYLQFGLVDDAKQVLLRLQEIGPRVLNDMKEFSHQIEIPTVELDAHVNGMTAGTFEDAMQRIASQYIPLRDDVEDQVINLSRKTPFQFLLSKQIASHEGRIAATVGPLEQDIDGNIVHQMSENLEFQRIFLHAVLEKAISKFKATSDLFIEYLFKSPLFTHEQQEFLNRSITSYLEGDYLLTIHLLVPQIEKSARQLARLTGGYVLKPRRDGGFNLRTLDEILRDSKLVQAVGEDVSLYFRVVLTNQRGWNVRNEVCHGDWPARYFSKGVADRLIHILLVLAQVRADDS